MKINLKYILENYLEHVNDANRFNMEVILL